MGCGCGGGNKKAQQIKAEEAQKLIDKQNEKKALLEQKVKKKIFI